MPKKREDQTPPPAAPPQEPQEPQEPTPEQRQELEQVGRAGAAAAAEGRDPAEAMREARDETSLELSDDDIDQIAGKLNDKLMSALRDAGAFDPPLEQVGPPAQPQAPAEHPSEPAGDGGGAPAPAPARKTFAQRFMGQ